MENQIANLTLPESANPEFILDYAGVLQLLPHRPPFLFVEGVRALEGGKSIVCQKNFSFQRPRQNPVEICRFISAKTSIVR